MDNYTISFEITPKGEEWEICECSGKPEANFIFQLLSDGYPEHKTTLYKNNEIIRKYEDYIETFYSGY